MIRREFCEVVGIDSPLFDAHRRVGNLPFELATVEAEDGQRRRWARFTVHECARWIAAQHLAAQGVTWSEAAAVLRAAGRDSVAVGPLGIGASAFETPGYCVARVEYATETGHESRHIARFEVLVGPLDAIAAAVAVKVENFNEQVRFASDRIVATSLIAANLSHAYHIAYARMDQLGIAHDGDGRMEPDATGGHDET